MYTQARNQSSKIRVSGPFCIWSLKNQFLMHILGKDY